MSDSYYDPPEDLEPTGRVEIRVVRPVEAWPYDVPAGTVEVEAEVDVSLPDGDAQVTEWRAYGEDGAELAEGKRCKGLDLTLEAVEVEQATERLVECARFEDDDAYDRARERDW